MALSNHLNPGMILSIGGKLYRVESAVKVAAPKGAPFIKAKLRNLSTQEITEKNFKMNQTLQDVVMQERRLEYLYPEGKNYLFLDISNLEKVLIPTQVVGSKVNYLKEGVELTAYFHEETIFSVELPQFLELMIAKMDVKENSKTGNRIAILETGAKVEVPPFIEMGDIIKVDTQADEYVQRV
jgi:elongation factor P